MATTAAETSSASGTKPEKNRGGRKTGDREGTRLDDHIDKPSTMQPGDAPFDTTDPDERATSVSPDKAAAARAGHQTVNAVIPLPQPERVEEDEAEHRIEEYKAPGPDGKLVTVKHNIDTGETEVG